MDHDGADTPKLLPGSAGRDYPVTSRRKAQPESVGIGDSTRTLELLRIFLPTRAKLYRKLRDLPVENLLHTGSEWAPQCVREQLEPDRLLPP